jgi:hypothetical protein
LPSIKSFQRFIGRYDVLRLRWGLLRETAGRQSQTNGRPAGKREEGAARNACSRRTAMAHDDLLESTISCIEAALWRVNHGDAEIEESFAKQILPRLSHSTMAG